MPSNEPTCLECHNILATNDSYNTTWTFYWCAIDNCSRRYLLTMPEDTYE